MTDRPILFSGQMVRAILAGEKTQTRRIAKWRKLTPSLDFGASHLRVTRQHLVGTPDGVWTLDTPGRGGWQARARLQTYQHGDRLWVRESCKYDWSGCDWNYAADNVSVCTERGYMLETPTPYRWPRGAVPAIHMPRVVSRITLTVTDVRVERLQSISEADVRAEGIAHAVPPFGDWSLISPLAGIAWKPADDPPPVLRFAYLWNSINGERTGAAWACNPWVVAVTFTAERRNIDAMPAQRAESTPERVGSAPLALFGEQP